MLTSDDIKVIVSKGEGFNIEFKVRVPQKVRDLAEEVCAFANAAGGYLLIGVDVLLVITNPGGLLNSIPLEKFGTISRSRNPMVFGLMERIRLVEYIGSGVMRMRDAMKEVALPQPEFGLKGTFSISLLKQDGFTAEPINVKNGLSEIQNKALALIATNSSITSSEMSETLAVSFAKIRRIIKYLKDNSYIERDGSDKKGIWIVMDKNVPVSEHVNEHVSEHVNEHVNGIVNVSIVDDKLSEIQNRTLALIRTNNAITTDELSDALSVTFRQIHRIIKQLKDNGYIERDGSDRTGIWIVKNEMSI